MVPNSCNIKEVLVVKEINLISVEKHQLAIKVVNQMRFVLEHVAFVPGIVVTETLRLTNWFGATVSVIVGYKTKVRTPLDDVIV